MNARNETKPSIGELVSSLSEKTSQLVRDEIRLASPANIFATTDDDVTRLKVVRAGERVRLSQADSG